MTTRPNEMSLLERMRFPCMIVYVGLGRAAHRCAERESRCRTRGDRHGSIG